MQKITMIPRSLMRCAITPYMLLGFLLIPTALHAQLLKKLEAVPIENPTGSIPVYRE